MTAPEILQSLNSKGVTRTRRAAFSVQGVIRKREKRAGCGMGTARLSPRCSHFISGTATLHDLSEPFIADSNVQNEVRSCLELARSTEAAVTSGERLAAARSAVELVKAYDRVLEHIRLVPLSPTEQKRARDQLAPVADLLRKYRLR
jgi:hypothetical protein